jgi:putative heme transporter
MAWQLLGVAAAAALMLWVAGELRVVVVPLLLATLLSSLTSAMADQLERVRIRRSLGAAVVVGAGSALLVGGVVLAVAPLARQMQTLVPKTLQGAAAVLDWVQDRAPAADLSGARQLLADPVASFGGNLTGLGAQALPLAAAAGELLTMTALTVVFWFFITRDARQLAAAALALVPDTHHQRVWRAARDSWRMLRRFLAGTTLVALIDAVGIGIGLWLLGVPAAGALTLLVFFGAFIPVVGATVTGVLAVLVALASGGFGLALSVGAVVLAVQQLESNVLQPMIMRRVVLLHPIVTLGVLAAGWSAAGLLGAFLAVPVTAAAAAAVKGYRQS